MESKDYIFTQCWKNVSVMSGTDHQGMSYTPDIKIKNLKYTNLLNNPVMAKNGIWTERKN